MTQYDVETISNIILQINMPIHVIPYCKLLKEYCEYDMYNCNKPAG